MSGRTPRSRCVKKRTREGFHDRPRALIRSVDLACASVRHDFRNAVRSSPSRLLDAALTHRRRRGISTTVCALAARRPPRRYLRLMAQVENYKRSSAEKTKGFNLEAKEETLREFMTLITAFENAATSVEAATEGEEKIQGNYQARARASEIAAPPRRPDRSTDCGGARVPFRCDAACSRRDPRGDRSPSPNTHTTTRSLSRRAFSRVSPALTAGDLPRAAREVRQARPRGVPRRRRRAVRPRRTRR